MVEIRTPIAKSWPSQWCLEANNLPIQVHGGYGYTREYNVEQFYRDNRLNPIHEGTHGIQAQDLLGRKGAMQDGAALRLVTESFARTSQPAIATGDAALAQHVRALDEVVVNLSEVKQRLLGAGDVRLMMANATVYLEAFGHIALAWIWLEQAIAARAELLRGEADADFLPGQVLSGSVLLPLGTAARWAAASPARSLDRTTQDGSQSARHRGIAARPPRRPHASRPVLPQCPTVARLVRIQRPARD
ncbi:hypothetical protein ASL20_24540 [Cupriavidus necator]|nr:hypothetical protein ASL20_24540 [Cupriavidus necator]